MRAPILLRPAWRRSVPDIRQAETAECGLACLAMIAAYHGRHSDLGSLRRRTGELLAGRPLYSGFPHGHASY